jgi:methionyl aminopeptidase
MVFTIEPALGLGGAALQKEPDGWSLRTRDRSPVAQFEHTIAVFADHTEVLTEL